MNCPICNVPLQLSEKQGVEIDYCPKCRGIWLDRGELEKIIERMEQPKPVRQDQAGIENRYDYDKHHGHHENHHGDHHGHHGRKSIWRELFD